MEALTGREALEFFETQGRKEPGTWGFWRVYGATPLTLRAGDILLSKVGDTDEVEADYVAERFTAKSAVRVGFVNQDGKRLTIGMAAPVIICRWGQHSTLDERVR
jgi:hypothetical protein